MKPTRFPQQTIELQRPPGMTEEQCGTLAVHQSEAGQCISCWRPSWRDRLRIAFGSPLWLWVWSGRTQPPVALDTESPFVDRPTEAERRHGESERDLNTLSREAWKILGVLVLALVLPGCATFGGPRHVGTVGLVSAHSVLGAIQDTEIRIVCGRPGAPQAPLCVPVPTHRQISAHLAEAFALEIRAAAVMRALPAGSPQPAEVVSLALQVNALVQEVLALMPDGKDKAALVQSIGGVR